MLQALYRIMSQVGVFILFFVVWEVLVDVMKIKPVILPAPTEIFKSIWTHREYLLKNTWPTFYAVGGGFLFAAIAGFIIAIGIGSFALDQ